MSDWPMCRSARRSLASSRGSEPKRNGVKGPPDRRMENGVSSYWLLLLCCVQSFLNTLYCMIMVVQEDFKII